MSTVNSISVPWPPLALDEAGWRNRLEDLATRAESLVGRPCTLQQSARLAMEMVALTWQAIGPETIAATCRASLLVGYPGVMASAPAALPAAAGGHRRGLRCAVLLG